MDPDIKPTSIQVEYKARCRGCSDLNRFYAVSKIEAGVIPDPNLMVHEDIEARGWIDGLCPRCVQARFPTNQP